MEHIDVEHGEAIPVTGGAIIATNQLPSYDPITLAKLFGRAVVVPDTIDGSLYEARRELDAGNLVVLVPQNHRARSRRLSLGHSGVAHLALSTGSPIIPVGVVGADATLPVGDGPLHRSPTTVRVGSAIRPGAIGERPTMRTRLALTNEVMRAISGLCGSVLGRPDHLVQV